MSRRTRNTLIALAVIAGLLLCSFGSIGAGITFGWFHVGSGNQESAVADNGRQLDLTSRINLGVLTQNGGGDESDSGNTGDTNGGNNGSDGTDWQSNCPDDPTMMSMTGLPRAIETNSPGDWETCKWNFQLATAQKITLPNDGLLTAKMADGSHVLWIGPTTVNNVLEGTLRLTRGYTPESYVHTTCGFVKHEIGYADNLRKRTNGVDNIQYQLGNITGCAGINLKVYKASGGNGGTNNDSTGSWTCPIKSAANAKAVLGGTGTWKQSADDTSKWVYTGTGAWESGAKLKYPGYGYYDFHGRPNEQVREQIPDDNATFNCVQ